jgi:serine/threonine-protein kinase
MSESPHRPEETTLDLRLAEALDGYCRQVREGLDPDPQACLAAHPELEQDLAECLEGVAAMEGLRAAIQPPEAEAVPFQPRTVGDYELLREVGRGGMGVVYEARQLRLGRRVALKMIKAGDLAGPSERERFRAEAQAVACLQHPNIVQIYEVGELEGRPYLALEFVDGCGLDQLLAGTPLPAAQAAGLLETLARAVQYAHQQGVVHRDLKPANVLLAFSREPRASAGSALARSSRLNECVPKIADFGLAKRRDGVSAQTQSGAVMGTPPYMAPEQAAGRTKEVGPATDIYALGAILYEMLTGRPPFKAETPWDTLAQVTSQEPVPPSRLQPKVPRDLETITLKCLQKEAKNRYASAADLAEDLRRFQAGEPIRARPVGAAERFWRWCRRHPALAGFVGTAAALLIAVTAAAVAVARDRAARLRDEVLRSNRYAAQGVASTVLWHLHHLGTAALRTAEDPQLRRLLLRNDRRGLQHYFERLEARYADPARGHVQPGGGPSFESWHLLDRKGILVADSSLGRSKTNESVLGRSFRGRDYFRGALGRAGATGMASVYVSRVYRSMNDAHHKFAITVPVRAGRGRRSRLLGVVAATVTTASTLGSLRLNDERRTAVLVGRRDANPPGGGATARQTPEYLILLHPAYHRGEDAIRVPGERLRAVHRPRPGSAFQLPDPGREADAELALDPDYRDPLAAHDERYQGRWLAGFAPVGNTEFVIIVQQRYREVEDSDLVWGGAAVALEVVLIAAVGWFALGRVLHRKPRLG